MAKLNVFTNANLYLEGKSLIGQVAEFQAPTMKVKLQDVEGLGLTSKMSVPVGLEPMEATMKFAGIYKDAIGKIANPQKKTPLMLRGNYVEVDDSGVTAQKLYKIEVICSCTEFNAGSAKMGEDPGMEAKLNVFFFKLEIDGAVKIKADLDNHIWEVDGKDMLGPAKGNMGI